MKTITIRYVDDDLAREIKNRARKDGLSVKKWILVALKKMTGLENETVFRKHNDLDHLAGGWSDKETEEFTKNTKIFEKVDKNSWG